MFSKAVGLGCKNIETISDSLSMLTDFRTYRKLVGKQARNLLNLLELFARSGPYLWREFRELYGTVSGSLQTTLWRRVSAASSISSWASSDRAVRRAICWTSADRHRWIHLNGHKVKIKCSKDESGCDQFWCNVYIYIPYPSPCNISTSFS